jgi:hypothetical protein
VAGILKRQKSPGGRLNKIEHRPFVGQKVSELALTHFGLGQQSNHVGQIAKIIQKISVKLLSINDVINPVFAFKILQFLIDGFVKKFFPSFEFLLGLFCVFLHFLLLHGYADD